MTAIICTVLDVVIKDEVERVKAERDEVESLSCLVSRWGKSKYEVTFLVLQNSDSA